MPYLKAGGTVSTTRPSPGAGPGGSGAVPDGIIAYIKSKVPATLVLDALGLATRCGNPRAVNMVLLGALAGSLPLNGKYGRRPWRKLCRKSFLKLIKRPLLPATNKGNDLPFGFQYGSNIVLLAGKQDPGSCFPAAARQLDRPCSRV